MVNAVSTHFDRRRKTKKIVSGTATRSRRMNAMTRSSPKPIMAMHVEA
jgi:hypothetical protein